MIEFVQRLRTLHRALQASQLQATAPSFFTGRRFADELAFPRGLLFAVAISAPFWAAVAFLVFELVR